LRSVEALSEFQSPQEPGIEKRLILVFVLTFVVILISQKLIFKNAPQKPEEQKQTQSQQAPTQPTGTPQAAAAVPPPAPAAVGTKQASAEQEIVVENGLYKITFTNKGAQVKSWILKKYKDERGNPLELVHLQAASQYGYPLSLWTWDQALRDKLNSALYVADHEGTVNAPASISFEYSDGDIVVKKSFSFDHSYVLSVDTQVTRGGQYQTALPAWPAGFGDATVAASYASQGLDYSNGKDVERLAAKKISSGNVVRGTIVWGGVLDQYFAAIFMPDRPQNAALATLHNALEVPKDPAKPKPGEVNHVEVLGAAVGEINAPSRARLFVGPKDVDLLDATHARGPNGEEVGPDLRAVVDFGWFGFIARPLFIWLKWTHNHWVANWGWSIVILTVIINLALLPLRITQMKSALKMQKLAPQMKQIQEKYKKFKMNDPRRQEQNKEVSALYKQHNVNPASGCFPLLIQMPFLFAFYKMLAIAIELRQAPWLWVTDLSAPDKWFILPVGIVLSTLFVQKMTPTAGMDPAQQKMLMYMMPVFLGFMSYTLASGLSLYWTMGNIIAIGQQWAMNKTELGREMRSEIEKRARKANK
jgi:YidC/Oxa1 family membrane protein insertase